MNQTQAFAWFSDLLVEHAEIFWSFFAVDMDAVLAEQLPDTWDSFPLFQILNDYLRMDGAFIPYIFELNVPTNSDLQRQIIWRTAVFINICVTRLHHKWLDM